jgi:hypothetical protein
VHTARAAGGNPRRGATEIARSKHRYEDKRIKGIRPSGTRRYVFVHHQHSGQSIQGCDPGGRGLLYFDFMITLTC